MTSTSTSTNPNTHIQLFTNPTIIPAEHDCEFDFDQNMSLLYHNNHNNAIIVPFSDSESDSSSSYDCDDSDDDGDGVGIGTENDDGIAAEFRRRFDRRDYNTIEGNDGHGDGDDQNHNNNDGDDPELPMLEPGATNCFDCYERPVKDEQKQKQKQRQSPRPADQQQPHHFQPQPQPPPPPPAASATIIVVTETEQNGLQSLDRMKIETCNRLEAITLESCQLQNHAATQITLIKAKFDSFFRRLEHQKQTLIGKVEQMAANIASELKQQTRELQLMLDLCHQVLRACVTTHCGLSGVDGWLLSSVLCVHPLSSSHRFSPHSHTYT